jgi:hypothetical protein
MVLKRLLLLMTGLVVACSQNEQLTENDPTTSSQVEVQKQAIQNGMTEEDRTYVVGLVIQQGWSGGSCSGSLIAPNLVLTAQHCIAPTSSEGISCGRTTFGSKYNANDIYVTTQTEFPRFGYYGVSEIIVPETGDEVCGNDIAMLILRENVMSSDAISIRPRLDDPVVVDERFTAAGYGHTGNGEGAGVRRSIEDRRVICSGFQNGCQDGNQGIYDNEWVGNDGTCQGDSGGPALDVNENVIGVLSRGPEGCIYPVYTDVVRYAQWIRDIATQAASAGGYSPASWVAGPEGGPPPDADEDGLPDRYDNCIDVINPSQQDYDQDGIGDLCDDLISGDRGGRCPVCNSCVNDDECGGQGAVCLQLQGGGVCTYPCRGDFECPDTTDCVEIGNGDNYCFNTDIYFSGVCPQGYLCGGEGTLPTPVEDDGACHVCESCTSGEDCASGVCASINNGPSICSRSCEDDTDCRNGSRCIDDGGRKLCVNDNYEELGVCPSDFVCGMTNVPVGGSEVEGGSTMMNGSGGMMNENSAGEESSAGDDSDPMVSIVIDEENDKSNDNLGCTSQGVNHTQTLPLFLLLGVIAIITRTRSSTL